MSSAPRLDEGGLIFQGGLKEVNFKLRVVYKVTGYVASRGEIRSTCAVRGDGGRAHKLQKQMKGWRERGGGSYWCVLNGAEVHAR